jgi:hypothetical protein
MKEDELVSACSRLIKSILAFTMMSGTHEAKGSQGRSRHGLKDNMEVAYK